MALQLFSVPYTVHFVAIYFVYTDYRKTLNYFERKHTFFTVHYDKNVSYIYLIGVTWRFFFFSSHFEYTTSKI